MAHSSAAPFVRHLRARQAASQHDCPPMTLTPGALLGHYEILSLLGEGGTGAAYEAEDLRLRRRVVVKILHPTDGAGREAGRRLLEEETARARAS